jgi:hypothetical protein
MQLYQQGGTSNRSFHEMNRFVSSLLLCGIMMLPAAAADAQGRPTQQSCSFIGEQTTTHFQFECDDNTGYLIDDLLVSTYDTSTLMAVTIPQSSWLVFRPAPGSESTVAVGWWDTQTQQVCALGGSDRALMTCGEVRWPGG